MSYKVKKVPATTNNITQGIINFLESRGHIADRMNRTGVYDPATKTFRKTSSKHNYLDIYACLAPLGLSLWVDTKRGRDKLSAGQEKFIKDILARGGMAYAVSSLAEFETIYLTEIEPRLKP